MKDKGIEIRTGNPNTDVRPEARRGSPNPGSAFRWVDAARIPPEPRGKSLRPTQARLTWRGFSSSSAAASDWIRDIGSPRLNELTDRVPRRADAPPSGHSSQIGLSNFDIADRGSNGLDPSAPGALSPTEANWHLGAYIHRRETKRLLLHRSTW